MDGLGVDGLGVDGSSKYDVDAPHIRLGTMVITFL